MKKTKLLVFLLIIISVFTFRSGVYANDVSVSMVEGASIRTTGEQGLRFAATISGNYDNQEHGFYLIYGIPNQTDLEKLSSFEEGITEINDKAVYRVLVSGVTQGNEFSVVLTGIPEQGYETNITVLAFIIRGTTEIFSPTQTTRSVAEVALNIYNAKPAEYTGSFQEAIDLIALPRKIKIIHSDGSVNYYSDFADEEFSLEENDELHLSRGTFNHQLLINVDNISVYGVNKDVKVNSNGERVNDQFEESVYKGNGGIEIAKGIKNININGLTFASNRAVMFNGENSNVLINNNLIKVTGNYGIRDDTGVYNEEQAYSNINIVDNFFSSTAQLYFRDLYFFAFVKSLSVTGNYFNNHREELSGDDYAIRVLRYANDSQIDIYDNNFRKYGANYVIDVGYEMGASNVREINNSININIEKNSFSSAYTKALAGNGIRVMYIGDNSTITILNNSQFRTSPYYNAIMLTGGSQANYDDRVENVKVEILFNKFYAAALTEVTKPEGRNEVTSRFTRIGLGLPLDAGITIDSNYFGSSTSRFAYTTNSSATALKNNNQIDLTTNKVDTSQESTDLYEALLNGFSTRVNSYLQKGPFDGINNAHGWGLEERDISIFIDNFDSVDNNLIEIQDGNLTYVGKKQYYLRLANSQGLTIGSCHGFENLEDMIVQVAYLYYAKEGKTQYDQHSGRRMLGGSPELATSEKNYFFDCSSFVSDVYSVTYGIPIYPEQTPTTTNTRKMVDYAKDNTDKAGVIAYVLNSDYSPETQQAKLDELLKLIVPGDVIVYRYENNSKGHAVLYVGNGKLLHVTGASYNWDKLEEIPENNGAVFEVSTGMFTNPSHSMYLFRSENNEFCILRPLAFNSPTISDSTKSRNLVSGLNLEKKADVSIYSGVSVGDNITYTISLTNTSDITLKDFYLRDKLSANETFVSVGEGGLRSDDDLTFYVDSILSGETIEFTYTIKVKKDNPSDTLLSSTQTRVFSLYSNPLYFSILDYSSPELDALESLIVNYDTESTTNLYSLLTAIYGANHPIVTSGFSTLYGKEFGILDLWGGKKFDISSINNSDYRVRLLKEAYLVTGDIIISKLDDKWQIFIYSPTKIIKYHINDGVSTISLNLDELTGHQEFKVLRPTLKKI